MSKFTGVFGDTYVLDDAPDSNREDIAIGIGFEFDAEHGHISWITRRAARTLLVELLKSFPYGETGTNVNAAVVIEATR